MVLIFRPTAKLIQLENSIRELSLLSRVGFANRALIEAGKVDSWAPICDALLTLECSKDVSVPTSMNIKIEDDALCERVREKIRVDLDLKRRVTTPYFVTLLYANFLSVLHSEKVRVGAKTEVAELSGPEMVATLVEMLLLNREADRGTLESVKSLLLNWRNKQVSGLFK